MPLYIWPCHSPPPSVERDGGIEMEPCLHFLTSHFCPFAIVARSPAPLLDTHTQGRRGNDQFACSFIPSSYYSWLTPLSVLASSFWLLMYLKRCTHESHSLHFSLFSPVVFPPNFFSVRQSAIDLLFIFHRRFERVIFIFLPLLLSPSVVVALALCCCRSVCYVVKTRTRRAL